MKKKIFFAAAVIISSTAHAQDSTRQLNEVVVTANKFPVKTSLTGKVLTVITREQLEKAGAKDLAQVLTEQAGVFINGANSNQGKDKSVFLRGAGVDRTLITVDGVPVYDASGVGSNFDIRLLSIDNVERVEILKGSQSTLYGSDAIGGVINIITRKAVAKTLGVNATASYGSYNTMHGNITVSGSNSKIESTAGYSFHKTDGINEAADTATVPHITDKDGFTQHSAFASVAFKPTEHVRINPYVRFTKFDGDIDQGAFTDELDFTTKLKNLQVGINNEFKFGDNVLKLLYNYNKTEREYIDDSVKSQNGFSTYSDGLYKATEHFADAYLVHTFPAVAKITVGVDYRNSSSDQSYMSVSFFGPYESELGKDSLKQNQLGIYTDFVLSTKMGLNVEMGARFNHHSAYGNNTVFNFNPSFLIKDQWKLFLNVSSAYRTPSLYQLYSEYGNKKLKPESGITMETGLQYFTKNQRINIRGTYFNRSVKDAIVFYTNPMTFQSMYINQDKQKDNGVEIEASFLFGKTTSLKAFYTYVDGKVTTNTAAKDTSYFNLLRRPRSSFGLSVGTNFSKHLYISTSVNAFGKIRDVGYDAFFNRFEPALKAYALWNSYAEYSINKIRSKVFVDLRNILNTTYNEVYGFNAMGFNCSAGIRFKF